MAKRRILTSIAAALIMFAAALIGTVVTASFFFRRNIEQKVTALFENGSTAKPSIVTEADLTELPEPVQRWLRRANVLGRPRVTAVRLKQRGRIRENPDDAWMEFDAIEYYTTDPPAFLWHGSVKPMSIVQAVDAYARGRGRLTVRVRSRIYGQSEP